MFFPDNLILDLTQTWGKNSRMCWSSASLFSLDTFFSEASVCLHISQHAELS